MSILARTPPVYTTARIYSALTVSAAQYLSSTARRDKGPVDTTKDALKKVDRTVSNAAVRGIETGGMCWKGARSLHYSILSIYSLLCCKFGELIRLVLAEKARDKAKDTIHTENKAAKDKAENWREKADEVVGRGRR